MAALMTGMTACGEIQPIQTDGGLPDATPAVPDAALPPDADIPPDAQVPPDASEPSLLAITHSTSLSVQNGRSLFCNDANQPPLQYNNSFFRVFHLPEFGVTGAFQVTRVLVGIEVADSPTGSQPAQVKLHTLPDGAALLFANLVTLDTYDLSITNRVRTRVQVDTDTLVPAGSTLVVEFFTPSGMTTGNRLYPGGNNQGQTGPSYSASADCAQLGLAEPTDWATFVDQDGANRHLVMSVYGQEAE